MDDRFPMSLFFSLLLKKKSVSGVQYPQQHNQDQFRFCHATFNSQLKNKVDNILTKTTVLRIMPLVYHTEMEV
jgi:hypothetical protein